MGLYDLARKVNAKRKALIKARDGFVPSPVRRIGQACPPRDRRLVAMTFDDGPDALTVEGRDRGLTQVILDELKEYGAKVTFDVIGSTADNYPDEKGELGTFMWSGRAFDHYPKFGADGLAGAKNRPELIRAILDGGHEISNHGSTHRLFGRMRAVYGQRHHFETLEQVVGDLEDLHGYLEREFGYTMRLGRRAHYIDKIPDGASAYDAYRIMGYNYMAASFDGAGWQPLASYDLEVDAMVKPLENALRADPESLNGKIIFQKDGSNMAERTPIADALPRQLRLLQDAGYQVVPVSALLEVSPFEDMDPASEEAESVKYLLSRGRAPGYKNNTFHGERNVTAGELYMMLADPEALRARRAMSPRELMAAAEAASPVKLGGISGRDLLRAAEKLGVTVDEGPLKDAASVRRSDAAVYAARLLRGLSK